MIIANHDIYKDVHTLGEFFTITTIHGKGGSNCLQIQAKANPWFPELPVTNPWISGFLSKSENLDQ